jgi:flagellar assembly protein FliH
MSLSNNSAQAKAESKAQKAFQMERFDSPGSSPLPQTGDYAFQAFCDDDANKGCSFRHILSDDIESAKGILAEAERIISDAKKKGASIERDAYEKGFAQGEKDGREIGTKKIDKALDSILQVSRELVATKKEFMKLLEKEVLGLVCRIAEKVVRGRITVDNSVIRETILEALSLAGDRSEIALKVSSEDIEYVKDLRPEFFERVKDLKSMTIESDLSISPGGCFIETAFGHVDASVESQLEKITDAVEGAFGQNGGEIVNRES